MNRRASTRETGSITAEVAILTTLFLVLMTLTVFGGRLAQAKNHVVGAAQDAARAASLRQNPGDAAAAARHAAEASLADLDVSCASSDIAVDTSQFHAGGVVRVRVSCVTALSDLALLGVPGSRTLSGSAAEPIDLLRSDP